LKVHHYRLLVHHIQGVIERLTDRHGVDPVHEGVVSKQLRPSATSFAMSSALPLANFASARNASCSFQRMADIDLQPVKACKF
jgi:hypothetical protein